jgi:hypothetical protein
MAAFLNVITADPQKQTFMQPDTLREWISTPAFVLPSGGEGYGYGFETQFDAASAAWVVGKSGGISSWSAQVWA